LSWGVQIGAALSDVMVIFTKPSAMNALRSEDGTELSLGPESGIALGPVGRRVSVSHGLSHLGQSNGGGGSTFGGQFPSFDAQPLQLQSSEEVVARAEAMRVEAAAQAAEASKHLKPAYSYSHSKGLFVGVSLEGSVLTVSVAVCGVYHVLSRFFLFLVYYQRPTPLLVAVLLLATGAPRCEYGFLRSSHQCGRCSRRRSPAASST